MFLLQGTAGPQLVTVTVGNMSQTASSPFTYDFNLTAQISHLSPQFTTVTGEFTDVSNAFLDLSPSPPLLQENDTFIQRV